ncbi:MAG TPA: helix-hairpin-helix domain-containing protein [Gemmatimonadota bacterium]|nr:helix-hairpin-helix domain-containing protein [Gemmatimonadota bacterium]
MLDLNRPERRALLLATTLVLLGGAVRVGLGPGPATFSFQEVDGGETGRSGSDDVEAGAGTERAGAPGLAGLRSAVDRNLDRSRRAAEPLAPGERIDLDSAPAWELERLPGVGPATARRIVMERQRSGGFSRVEDLERVRGIGPARLQRILPYVITHSRPYYERDGAGRAARRRLSRVSDGPSRNGREAPDGPRLDVNRATAQELTRLPGVGPSIARRIVEIREREGGFRSVEDLRAVPGIGPARFDLIRERVRVR